MGGRHPGSGPVVDVGGRSADELTLHGVKASPEELPPVRRLLRLWATEAGLPREEVEDLVLATDEAMANVVDHAYPDGIGSFDLDAVHDPGGPIVITVTDYGQWHAPVMTPEQSLRGRGLQLMKGLAHAVDIETLATGTRVRMTF
jgi:serine/threonine-protein kinase RsbW